jgi:hypothetical protein
MDGSHEVSRTSCTCGTAVMLTGLLSQAGWFVRQMASQVEDQVTFMAALERKPNSHFSLQTSEVPLGRVLSIDSMACLRLHQSAFLTPL